MNRYEAFLLGAALFVAGIITAAFIGGMEGLAMQQCMEIHSLDTCHAIVYGG